MADIKGMSQEDDHIRNIEEIKHHRKAKVERLRPVSGKQKPVPASEVPNLAEEQKVVPDAATLSVPELLRELDACKVGENWQRYEALAKRALLLIFGNLVDQDNQGVHVPIGGGFVDIELYFCDEMAEFYPHWVIWRMEYGIKSILAEIKNLRGKATHGHVGQLKVYIDLNNEGKFAFLVSRNGFTSEAMETLKFYNKKGYLMIPLKHDDLKNLLKLSKHDRKKKKIMRYLRRIRELVKRVK